MGVCPSNMIAAEMNPTQTGFRNLARQTTYWDANAVDDKGRTGCYVNVPDIEKVFAEVDAAVLAELYECGVISDKIKQQLEEGHSVAQDKPCYEACRMDWNRGKEGRYNEVPTDIVAFKCHWKFTRNWYYWVAKGPGIPPTAAEEFHKKWGTQVRVEGHCGCPSPLEYCHGFAVSSYHIDTKEGLKAFVEFLGTIHKPKPDDAKD